MRPLHACWLCVLVVVSAGLVSSLPAHGQQARPAPNCVGLSRSDAGLRLEQIGWTGQWRSAGPPPAPQQQDTVAFQAPPAGTPSLSRGALILWVYDAVPAHVIPAPAVAVPDCSRWPGSVFDPASASCRCVDGQWWRLDGEGCTSRDDAAAQFCAKEWPGSVPAWSASGLLQCACPPDLYWDEEARACGAAPIGAATDCSERWPGTTPVFSPGAFAYECVCPNGTRWDERRNRCQDATEPAFAATAPLPPAPAMPPPPGAAPEPAGQGVPVPPSSAPPPGAEEGGVPPPPPAASGGGGAGGECERLLSEIRGRAAAGQAREADALALRAATRGCDPGAISDAVKGGPDAGAAPPPALPPQRPATRY